MAKNSSAGNLDMPKRICKGLIFIEKVKILKLIRKEEKSYAEVAKISAKIASPIREIVKKKKEICALLLHLRLQSFGHSA